MHSTPQPIRGIVTFGLKGKAIIGLGGLVLLALLLTAGTAYWQSLQLAEQVALDQALTAVEKVGKQIETDIAESRHGLMIIRDTPPIQAIIRTRDAGGIDPDTGDKLEFWEQRLATIFNSFMTQLPQLVQLRYLDETGQELVRVDALDGQLRSIARDALQNKSSRAYFIETMKLAQNGIFISRLSLDREHGLIRQPHQAVLRIAAPVFDHAGNRRGILVLNMLAEKLFTGLITDNNGIQYFVADPGGYFLLHPDVSKTFGFDLGFDYTLKNELPKLAAQLAVHAKGVAYYPDDGKVEAFHKLFFDSASQDNFLSLIAVIPDAVVFAGVRAKLTPLLLTMLGLVALSLLLISWLINRIIVAPVMELAAAAEKLQAGDLSVRLPERAANDELQLLYKTLNRFADNQQQTTQQLQHEVAIKNLHLSSIVDSIVDGLITIDSVGSIQSFNPAAEHIFGYAEAEVIGQNIKMLMPEPYHSEHDGYLQHFQQTGEKKIIGSGREVMGQRKDGSSFAMDLAVSDISFDGSSGFVGTIRDITERKHNENELLNFSSRLELAARSMNLGIWEYKIKTGELIWDDRMFELYGVNRAQFSGAYEAWEHALHPEDLEQAAADLQAAIAGEKDFNPIFRVVWPNGEIRQIHAAALIQKDAQGQPEQMIGVNWDVTERQQAEAALLEAKQAAEAANKAKSDFLSSMSHELRTPLNAILGFTQLMETNPEEPLTTEQEECTRQILKGGNHLLELINEVLDMARIESGKVTLSIENVHPATVLTTCIDFISSMAEKRGIRIHDLSAGSEPPVVRADYTRFKQVLLNLLSNAVKYNHENGEIWLDCQPSENNTLRISVRDSGPGIAEEKRQAVFAPFSRLGAEGSAIEGTGIGLTIARKLMGLMDGQIDFNSVLGEGSTFWLELPLATEEQLKMSAPDKTTDKRVHRQPAADVRVSKTLLYVEDNPANMSLMEHIIGRMADIELLCAHTAELGLELAENRRPELIIMDINLPGMNGFEALKQLQHNALTNAIPVVALSANAMRKDIERGLAAGFAAYLTKPIQISEIHKVIHELLREQP